VRAPHKNARSLLGFRRRVPRRPLIVTAILAVVLGFLAFSEAHDLSPDAARQKAVDHLHGVCGTGVVLSEVRVREARDEDGRFDRFDVTAVVTRAPGDVLSVRVSVWPDITVGPRIPTGGGDHVALLEFNDNVELREAATGC
jgi:hypothetical protein